MGISIDFRGGLIVMHFFSSISILNILTDFLGERFLVFEWNRRLLVSAYIG